MRCRYLVHANAGLSNGMLGWMPRGDHAWMQGGWVCMDPTMIYKMCQLLINNSDLKLITHNCNLILLVLYNYVIEGD